jgi:hypothetical protein
MPLARPVVTRRTADAPGVTGFGVRYTVAETLLTGRERPEHGGSMANSKSKHMRVKSERRQKWKARKRRQKAAKSTQAKK